MTDENSDKTPTEADKEKQKLFSEFMSKGANKNIAMVPQETTIRIIVELMIEKKISSVLVHDPEENVTGIVTEKDIVKKLTLLDFEDKLEKNALTLASRPVIFVNQQSYQEEIIKYHLEKRIHHFPVANCKEPKTENVIAIISSGDFLRQFILAETDSQNDSESEVVPENPIELFFLNGSGAENSKSVRCLENLGVDITRVTDFHSFFRVHGNRNPPIMFDIDSFPVKDGKKLIQILKKYLGPVIFITNNASLVQAFRMHLNPELQVISLKPIDYTYIHWLLKQKWGKSN